MKLAISSLYIPECDSDVPLEDDMQQGDGAHQQRLHHQREEVAARRDGVPPPPPPPRHRRQRPRPGRAAVSAKRPLGSV